jgi:Mg2+/Co2+ transporter CorB
MLEPALAQIGALVVLDRRLGVLLGFRSGADLAFAPARTRDGRTQTQGREAVLRLLEDRNRFLTSILIGNTVVLLAADSLATVLFVRAGVPNPALWSTLVMTVCC